MAKDYFDHNAKKSQGASGTWCVLPFDRRRSRRRPGAVATTITEHGCTVRSVVRSVRHEEITMSCEGAE